MCEPPQELHGTSSKTLLALTRRANKTSLAGFSQHGLESIAIKPRLCSSAPVGVHVATPSKRLQYIQKRDVDKAIPIAVHIGRTVSAAPETYRRGASVGSGPEVPGPALNFLACEALFDQCRQPREPRSLVATASEPRLRRDPHHYTTPPPHLATGRALHTRHQQHRTRAPTTRRSFFLALYSSSKKNHSSDFPR